jgi:hypothetical protein
VSGLFLTELDVAGDATAWEAAGFMVDDGVRVGQLHLRIDEGESGIGTMELTEVAPSNEVAHPNGALILDHLVVFSPDPEETTNAYAKFGWEPRRTRDAGGGRTQTFFKSGEIVIELIGPMPHVAEAQLWGLAFTVRDLDACAALLGDALGRIKDAVQSGRQIATLRHEACGLTIPIAFMSP